MGLYEAAAAVARWEGPWRAADVAAAAVVAGDDARGMKTRGGDCEDRGGSRGRAAAGAAGLKSTVASFFVFFVSVLPFFCSSVSVSVFWLLYCLMVLLLGRSIGIAGGRAIDRSPGKLRADSSLVVGGVVFVFCSFIPGSAIQRKLNHGR